MKVCTDCGSKNIRTTPGRAKKRATCSNCGREAVIYIWRSKKYPPVICRSCYLHFREVRNSVVK